MLRKIRLTLAVLFFTAVTLLFLDFTGTLGVECGSCGVPRAADTCLRTGVLLNHLSIRRDAGHHRLGGQETEKEPLRLFSRQIVVAV